MLKIKDIITGNVSNSPADVAAEPFVLVLGLPIIVPCAAVYLSYKGVRYIGSKIVDKLETKKYNKEMAIHEGTHDTMPVLKNKKSKRLVYRNTEGENNDKI